MSARYKCPRCNDQQLTTDSASQALCYPCGVARVLVSAVEYYVEGYLAAIRKEGPQEILKRLYERVLIWRIFQSDLSWDDIDRCRRINLAPERRPNEATVRGTPGPLEGNNQRRGSPALNDPSTPGSTCPGSEVQAEAEGRTKGQA